MTTPHNDMLSGPLTEDLRADLKKVLLALYTRPCSCRGDYARSKAVVLAMAASEDLITSKLPEGYANEWRLTSKGLRYLEQEIYG